jgi:hypothetical protein
MSIIEDFDQVLTKPERQVMAQLTTPSKIQAFLDEFPYNVESDYRCPLRVFRERIAHCFDGALFAAAALRRLGYPSLVLNMLPNDRDDDHMLTLYRRDRYWGGCGQIQFRRIAIS